MQLINWIIKDWLIHIITTISNFIIMNEMKYIFLKISNIANISIYYIVWSTDQGTKIFFVGPNFFQKNHRMQLVLFNLFLDNFIAYKTKLLFAHSWLSMVQFTTQFIPNNQVYYSSWIKVHLKHLDKYSFSSRATFIATNIFVQFI